VKRWKVFVIVAMVVGLGAAVVGAVATARGAGGSERSTVPGPGMMGQNGSAAQQGVPGGMMLGGSGMMLRGVGNRQLTGEMAKLMQEHAKDMSAWLQKYGADPASAAAQKALQQLRTEHQADMQTLWGQSPGSSSSSGSGPYGPGMMSGTSGGMMGGW
jgi:hypothetical protein